jgi:stage V sporulation protein AD
MAQKSIIKQVSARIIAAGTVVGGAEMAGPLAEKFDFHDKSDRFDQPTWEKSESEMQRIALATAISKSGFHTKDVGAIFAGDLLNQCVGSAYGLLEYDVPFYGIYGACSTSAEGIMLASMMTSAGYFSLCGAVTSSHNCSAERQYRSPIEYGSQKPPSAQWTVTGAGAFVVGSEEAANGKGVKICEVLPGIVVDKGITDANNMGAAMAPAAASTLVRYFSESKARPSDFDLILTGDLGQVGSSILCDLMKKEGIDISHAHNDCGMMIYRGVEHPDVNSGGSGCGCAATVLGAHVLPLIESGELKNVLFMATGAMMSPSSVQQGLSIPAVAHLLHLTRD